MAVLGQIRRRGLILISIIGLALFAFIAEEGFRSCETTRNNQRQQIGEVLGEKINVQDFQKLLDEYTEVVKVQQGVESLSEDQLNSIKDQVWNDLVQSKIIEEECSELGLAVTDEELQAILREGTNPMLAGTPFVNQQTGRFDVNALQKFLAEYKAAQSTNPELSRQYEAIYRFWTFTEKSIRTQLLRQKYQNLLAHCIISNPVEAKMDFEAASTEYKVQLAAFPYSSVDDKKVEATEAEIKAKYEEMKPFFIQPAETRSVRYISVPIRASQADRQALDKEFAAYAKELAAAADPSEVVRKSTSAVQYAGLPVGKNALPSDVSQRIDSMAVGAVAGPYENLGDNSLNLIKLVAKQQLPDSVEFRQIAVSGKDMAAVRATADSILGALRSGANFDTVAAKYGQTGDKTWLTTAQYQGATSIDKDSKAFLNALNTAAVNEIQKIEMAQSCMVVQVTDRRNMITKYTAAVVKKPIDFSKETRQAAYNKFSSFVSANLKAEDIAKNAAKAGYQLQEAADVSTSEHNMLGIRSTREPLKWLFEAEEGSVSPMYECGDNGDNLLLVILDRVNKKGYRSLDDKQVREFVKAEVLKDKKAELLAKTAVGITSIAQAAQKGAVVDTVEHVTFNAPMYISKANASEYSVCGAIAAAKQGEFSKTPVKGDQGLYLFQVVERKQLPMQFSAKGSELDVRQKALRFVGSFMQELYLKADVTDNRYLFF